MLGRLCQPRQAGLSPKRGGFMTDLSGLSFVRPSDVETMVVDLGIIKGIGETRITLPNGFSFGVFLLEPGKGHVRHNLPGSEEILYVVSGQGRQMIDIDGERWQPITAG